MGFRNAEAAISQWRHLSDRDARCLLVMAVMSADADTKDGQPARTYWGGHAALAWALGYTPADADPTPGHLRNVRRVIASLVQAGAVKRVDEARGGENARYLVVVDPRQ